MAENFGVLQQVAINEIRVSSLAILKEIEKSMLHPDAYASFKTKLEKLPGNVVLIASHAQLDNKKEKVRL